MRLDNTLHQLVDRDDFDNVILRVPMEITDEWQDYVSVVWEINPDGTVLLTPKKEYG